MRDALSTSDAVDIGRRIAELEQQLAAERSRSVTLEQERDRAKAAYQRVLAELEMLRRRIFVASAERVDSTQLQLQFAEKLAELDALAGAVPDGAHRPDDESRDEPPSKPKRKPKGRRDLLELDLPEERIELRDAELEAQAKCIGFEESAKIGYRKGGPIRIVIARAKYATETEAGQTLLETTPLPPESFPRSLAAPSLLAHIVTDKFCDGLPLYRQEERFTRDGVPLDRGTMCRWVEDAGATLGATIVEAMRKDALAHAFCIATDATGIAIQPEQTKDKKRQAARKGHYFVLLADNDHVFFEFTPKETSEAVSRMFRGFSGYIQADAKSVYDVLFRPPTERPPPAEGEEPDESVRHEVGCWSHARRKFWEAAVSLKSDVAREALVRIQRIFLFEDDWKKEPPARIKEMRKAHTRPHLDALFTWAQAEYERVINERGPLRSAFGYLVRQKEALMRFLEDGKLRVDNNASERALRRIAVGRKAWLFVGSDLHAEASGHLMGLIASARLHGLHPEDYLREVLRVLAHWPRERYLELAPKYWAATRARLVADELRADFGNLTVPAPIAEPNAAQEQASG